MKRGKGEGVYKVLAGKWGPWIVVSSAKQVVVGCGMLLPVNEEYWCEQLPCERALGFLRGSVTWEGVDMRFEKNRYWTGLDREIRQAWIFRDEHAAGERRGVCLEAGTGRLGAGRTKQQMG